MEAAIVVTRRPHVRQKQFLDFQRNLRYAPMWALVSAISCAEVSGKRLAECGPKLNTTSMSSTRRHDAGRSAKIASHLPPTQTLQWKCDGL